MQVADVEMVRAVRREIARHCLDVSETTVSAIHGVVHLNGRIRPLKGHENDFEQEIHAMMKGVRMRSDIRDVILECTGPDGQSLGSMSRTRSRPGS